MINLRRAAEEIAKNKEMKLTSGQVGRLRNWERDLQRGSLSVEDAMKNIRGEFSYKFDRSDYGKIEREIS